jgi:hypothetical protein
MPTKILFASTLLITIGIFAFAIKKNKLRFAIFFALVSWSIIQSFITIKNIYNTNTYQFPPKIFLLGILPTLLFLILIFTLKKGLAFILSLNLTYLTLIQVIRVPIEITLFRLYIETNVPEIMTFEGRNFDIISGIIAPFITYLVVKNPLKNKYIILIYNIIALGLLINIVALAILSAPTSFQKHGFNQPNIAILNFPFSLLPTVIVPIILFCHLASIFKLLKMNAIKN